ncbi:MAG: tRNA uridine-5-carboxymethylaminomethyl(34) synthesis GTPase MnmE, partial [Lachnospiraceae bacterium]
MKRTDTIAAIATALGESGIGIIRISGEDAVSIADKIYSGKKRLIEADSHTINYGHIFFGEEIIDEVLVMLMKAPRTFTGEDTVEINCHGGILILEKVLHAVLESG